MEINTKLSLQIPNTSPIHKKLPKIKSEDTTYKKLAPPQDIVIRKLDIKA